MLIESAVINKNDIGGIGFPKENNTIILDDKEFDDFIERIKRMVRSQESVLHLNGDSEFQGVILFSDKNTFFTSTQLNFSDIKNITWQLQLDPNLRSKRFNSNFFKFESEKCYIMVKRYINSSSNDQVFVGHVLLKNRKTSMVLNQKIINI